MCLERVLHSSGFAGSPQLSRFLRHVVECALTGQAALLKEITVGVEVFKRPSGYDPKVDPIVRVEARRLRNRLDDYYANGGAGDSVRILLPKGTYLPSFTRCTSERTRPAASPARRYWLAAAAFLGLACLALAAAALVRNGAQGSLVATFWGALLMDREPALVIPADSALVLYQDLTGHAVSLEDYITGEYRTQPERSGLFNSEQLKSISRRRYTSIADLEFTARLARRPETAPRGIVTRYARDVQLADLKSRTVILIGSRHSNPWVEVFESETTFRIAHDEVTKDFTLINTAPQPGEPSGVIIHPLEAQHEAFAIVTYHRKKDASGRVLMVAGMTGAGTEAAADFVMNESSLEPWLRKAQRGTDVGGFDILLRTTYLDGRGRKGEVVAFHPEH